MLLYLINCIIIKCNNKFNRPLRQLFSVGLENMVASYRTGSNQTSPIFNQIIEGDTEKKCLKQEFGTDAACNSWIWFYVSMLQP